MSETINWSSSKGNKYIQKYSYEIVESRIKELQILWDFREEKNHFQMEFGACWRGIQNDLVELG